MVVLLFVAETIPSFGNILDLVGASTVTLLTFVMPPYFYMRLCDSSTDNKDWTERLGNAGSNAMGRWIRSLLTTN